MALSLLVGLLFAQGEAAQTPPAKISFEEPAAPLSRILPDLAKATNLPLKLGKAMPNYVIDISVKDVSVKDLMQKVAEATAGTWDESEHSFFLTPSDGARALVTAEAQKARTADIVDALKKMAAPKPKNQPGSPTAVHFIGMGLSGNNDEFFPKVMTVIGAEKLATMQPGDRVVFSTKPLAHQYPMPVGNEALAAYVLRFNNRAADELGKMKAQMGQGQSANDDNLDGIPGVTQTIGAWSKADLVISQSSGMLAMFDMGGLSCDLVFYNAKGEKLNSDHASLPDSHGLDIVQEAMTAAGSPTSKKPETAAAPAEKAIDLSPETIRFLSATMGDQNDSSPLAKKLPKATPEDKAAIKARNLRPDLYEPLSYTCDLITGMAKAKNLQLVACVPDSTFMSLLFVLFGQVTPSAVEKQLKANSEIVCHQKDGWFTSTPVDFRVNPMDRADLTRICQDISKGVTPTIEWRAQAALLGLGDYFRGPLGMIWISMFSQGTDENNGTLGTATMLNLSDWNMLHLYGELDDNQKAALARDKRLSLNQMNDAARALIDRMIFSAEDIWMAGSSLNVDFKPDNDSLFGPTEQIFDQQQELLSDGMMANDYRAEPTEVAPNGIPDQSALTVKETNTTVLMPIYEKGKNSYGWGQNAMTAEELGNYEAMLQSPHRNPGIPNADLYTPPKITGVRVTNKRTFHFRLWVATDTFKSMTLDDYGQPSEQVYTLATLPADLQKNFDKAKADALEMYKNSNGDGDDTVPVTGGRGGVPK